VVSIHFVVVDLLFRVAIVDSLTILIAVFVLFDLFSLLFFV